MEWQKVFKKSLLRQGVGDRKTTFLWRSKIASHIPHRHQHTNTYKPVRIKNKWNCNKEISLIIIHDQLVGLIRLFQMIDHKRSQLIPNTTLKSTLSHQTDRAMSLLTSLPYCVVASFLSSVSSSFTSSSLLLTLTGRLSQECWRIKALHGKLNSLIWLHPVVVN